MATADHPRLGPVTMVGPRRLVVRLAGAPETPRFSICTLVTNWTQYDECVASYRAHGFGDETCEYLVLDNSAGNRADAFVGLNEFLQAANGDYVVLTHQDITLIEHDRSTLEQMLAALTDRDERWGVCGNAGFTDDGWPALCLSHPHRDADIRGGPFPVRVMSLDENFIVVRKLANLALSGDLGGFHHYGVDLCTVADFLGWNAYVIGFHLRHHSGGNMDASYERSIQAFTAKCARALRPRWVHLVTQRSFHVAGNGTGRRRAGWLRKLGQFLGSVPRADQLDDPAAIEAHARRRERNGQPT